MKTIREPFEQYLKDLGYSSIQILIAWNDVQQTIYTDYFTLEIMTRDLLQTPEKTRELMKPYLRKQSIVA